MNILIVGSGDIENNILLSEHKKCDFVVSADGGAKALFKNNLSPNVIIGDLDSIDLETKRYFESKDVEFKVFPTKKDFTDMDSCIDYAISLHAKSITILGATGTRLDHTLGNILLLKSILEKNILGKIIDKNNEIYLVNDELEIYKNDKQYVSIIPFLSEGVNVTTSGFMYEIKNFDILLGSTIGISNELKNDNGLVKVNRGIAIIIRSKD